MVYLRGGTVVQEPSAIDRVLSFPYRIYEFIMFFIMTLIDPKAAKKASEAMRSSSVRAGGNRTGSGRGGGNVRGMGNVKSGASSCGPAGA